MKKSTLLRTLFWKYRTRLGLADIEKTEEQEIVTLFHRLYYDLGANGKTWTDTHWLGIPVAKCPFDLWVYQEILFSSKPDLIIETGTAAGGSAYFMACMMDLIGKGRIITVDIAEQKVPQHDRITYLHGSSVEHGILDRIEREARGSDRVMVILDSDHSADYVLRELQHYHPLVTKGEYLIVEDTNVNGHPVFREHGAGPAEAVEKFLEECRNFEIDRGMEKFLLTFNPNGYLKKVSDS